MNMMISSKFSCPICGQELKLIKNKSYKCIKKHSYDISKSNYVNLLPFNKKNSGDDKDLLASREAFLNSGHYLSLVAYISKFIQINKIESMIDCACGTGYYSRKLNIFLQEIYAFDIAKEGLKYFKNSTINRFVASTSKIPILDNSFDLCLSIFGQTNFTEFLRITKNQGYIMIVRPGKKHLLELKRLVYPMVYLNNDDPERKENLVESFNLSYQSLLNRQELIDLWNMTPYKYKSEQLVEYKFPSELLLTFDFKIDIYQKGVV